MRALVGLLVLLGLAMAPSPAAAGGGVLQCGSLAPVATECTDPRGLRWPADGTLETVGGGFVGSVEARLEWPGGTHAVRCESLALDHLSPLALWRCTTEGARPAPGTVVTLRCSAAGHPGAPVGPWGPFGCIAG